MPKKKKKTKSKKKTKVRKKTAVKKKTKVKRKKSKKNLKKSEKPTLRFDDFEKENAIVNFYNSHII